MTTFRPIGCVAMAGLMLAAQLAARPACAGSGALPDGAPTNTICQTESLTGLLGLDATEANILKARQLSGAKNVRVIEPGAMVTMDFRPDRLNIELNKHAKMARLRCG